MQGQGGEADQGAGVEEEEEASGVAEEEVVGGVFSDLC